MIPCELSKTVSFAALIMKDITVFLVWSRSPVKFVCCISFWLASNAFCLFKSIAIIL